MLDGLVRGKYVLTETNYCAVMYEEPRHREGILTGRPRCTAAGRYMDTAGRVICERCAAGRVVAKLTDIPELLEVIDRLIDSKEDLTDSMRAHLRDLVARAPEHSP